MKATARDIHGAALDETIAHRSDADKPGSREAITPRGQRYTFASGDRPLDGYTIKRAVGRGGFGEVYYATSDAGKEVALKLITRNLEVERRGVLQCMNLKCPNLITIYDLRDNDEGDTFVVMEYINGPNLASVLAQHPHGLPPAEIRAWLKGLIDGVAYLHDHGIVHRDLKPANLFMEDGVVKIGDYGLSKAIAQSRGDTGHSECVGTCHYMAPETSTGKYQKPIDIYAIGVIIYELVTGRVPFDGESVGEVLMKHLTSRPDLTPLPQPYRSIVERALAKDPNHRPSRVQDLLLPGDAPREAAVRFIGDNTPNAVIPIDAGDTLPAAPADDVMRIGMEDPVLYIGPETRPPRPRPQSPPPRQPARPGRLWGRNARPASPAPAPVARRPSPAPTPPPAPPLPSGRVRVAELTTSMVAAAPLSFLMSGVCLPLYDGLGIGLPADPPQLALLFGMTLLGTWAALVPARLWEDRQTSGWNRRLVMLTLGLAVGLLGALVAGWSGINPLPSQAPGTRSMLVEWSNTTGLDARLIGPAAFAGVFGLAFALNGWNQLTARNRKGRFRLLPVAWSGLIGGLVGAALPVPQAWAALVLILIAAVTQAVSPWSRPAAEAARHARRMAA